MLYIEARQCYQGPRPPDKTIEGKRTGVKNMAGRLKTVRELKEGRKEGSKK